MNLRVMAFDFARAAFRAAKKRSVGPLIFEIARSEMTYTDQRPAEYTASILAAAIAEGWKGPVFIQGDHFQVSSKKYATSPDSEIKAIQDLIGEAVQAGFYNIDIDTSTMVDLARRPFRNSRRSTASCARISPPSSGRSSPPESRFRSAEKSAKWAATTAPKRNCARSSGYMPMNSRR